MPATLREAGTQDFIDSGPSNFNLAHAGFFYRLQRRVKPGFCSHVTSSNRMHGQPRFTSWQATLCDAVDRSWTH